MSVYAHTFRVLELGKASTKLNQTQPDSTRLNQTQPNSTKLMQTHANTCKHTQTHANTPRLTHTQPSTPKHTQTQARTGMARSLKPGLFKNIYMSPSESHTTLRVVAANQAFPRGLANCTNVSRSGISDLRPYRCLRIHPDPQKSENHKKNREKKPRTHFGGSVLSLEHPSGFFVFLSRT
jgi:hypothetical protein